MHSTNKIIREIYTLAWPVIIGQLGHISMAVVDNIMVGQLGAEDLAAVALANTLFVLVMVIGFTDNSKFAPTLDFFKNSICDFDKIDEIFEFGGGHGRLCKIICDSGFSGNYTIFDFPQMIKLQKAFLKNHNNIKYIDDFDLLVLPVGSNSLFISTSAIEESPKNVREKMFDF